ncbi:MAG: SURF1 family protein [Bauldia sp.]|nr:SURF1 family protein [Bauldia sp.]
MSTFATRRFVLLTVLAAAAFAVLVSLGIWQLARLQWKEALIARVEARVDDEAVAAPGRDAWPTLDLSEEEYLPVALSGHFLNDREIHVVYTLTEPKGRLGGLGYMVMTPFETDDGWIAYVNRGFVPREKKDAATRAEGQIEGETVVTGLLRAPSRSAWFAPGDDPRGNEWFSRDPQAFAAASGLPAADVAPYIVDARADPDLPGGIPQGGETLIAFPNNHLQYVLTWFGLALALAAVFVAYVVRLRRGGD